MINLNCNIAGRIRRETLNGRQYLVAPLCLIVPGVLHGSSGPLLYTLSEIRRNPSAWNHVPIVVEHPVIGGRAVSARIPEVLNSTAIGIVLRARATDRLIAEGWFDIEATRRVNPRILSALKRGKRLEVSTGLRLDIDPRAGTYGGRDYVGIARNFQPDHLAILPRGVGACSVRDGCGVLANAEPKPLSLEVLNRMVRHYERLEANEPDDDDCLPLPSWRDDEPEPVKDKPCRRKDDLLPLPSLLGALKRPQ